MKRLLLALQDQRTGGLFTYSLVVADNDRAESAKSVVAEFAAASSISTIYCIEPEQNIAMARNKAVENAIGEFIAFIDDDEIPAADWLSNLFRAAEAYGTDGVLGPVRPSFDHVPPNWVIKGRFFERPEYNTGYRLSSGETRTGNVLFRRKIIDGICPVFKPEFGTGSEDVDFFNRMMQAGCVFIWCNEAVVHETVPATRCTCGYLLRRALLRGSTFPSRGKHGIRPFATSMIAVPLYTLALPPMTLFGRHFVIRYLIKLLDHLSRISAFLGWKLVDERKI